MTSFKRTQRKYVQKAYRVRNWREYETGLRARGSLTVWLGLTDGKLANWNSPRPTLGVSAQPFGCDEAAVGSLATVTAAGARSRHEIKGPSEVQDEVSRGELVSVRAGLGPARGRDAKP